MVSPAPKDFVVTIRMDVATQRELQRLTAGLEAWKLFDLPRKRLSVSDALEVIRTDVSRRLGGERGDFEVAYAIEPTRRVSGMMADVQRDFGSEPVPVEVAGHVQAALDAARAELVTRLVEYRRTVGAADTSPP